jgi:hypothetical protein
MCSLLSCRLGSRYAVGSLQTLQITEVQFAKLAKTDGLCLAALVATHKVEHESSPLVHREGVAALQTLRIHLVSHDSIPL